MSQQSNILKVQLENESEETVFKVEDFLVPTWHKGQNISLTRIKKKVLVVMIAPSNFNFKGSNESNSVLGV